MSVNFNLDVSVDELNLPPLENYEEAEFLLDKIKIGNFNKKYWGRLKLQITDEERALNIQMRDKAAVRNRGKRPVEVDYANVGEKDNIYWFRPSECFANVIVPIFMLNNRQSNSLDRYQIIMNSYHAAIFDTRDGILYDPTIDTLEEAGAGYLGDEKKISTLGLLITKEAISLGSNQIQVGTFTLVEYLNGTKCKLTNRSLLEIFNNAIGREALRASDVGDDLSPV